MSESEPSKPLAINERSAAMMDLRTGVIAKAERGPAHKAPQTPRDADQRQGRLETAGNQPDGS